MLRNGQTQPTTFPKRGPNDETVPRVVHEETGQPPQATAPPHPPPLRGPGGPEVVDDHVRQLQWRRLHGDGYDDLAVGVPYEDVGGVTDAGMVNVVYGSSTGLTATGSQTWQQ
ncbi:MAG: integrin alpha, partial [Planctomycetota bacterium]